MVTDTQKTGPIEFQGMDPSEEFLFFFRQHWVRLLWPFFRMIGWTLLIAVGIGFFGIAVEDPVTRRIGIAALLALFVAIQGSFLTRFYRHFLYVIIVSDRKIHRIKKTFLAVDDHQSIDLSSLQEIRKSQHGPIQNLLGFGTLTLEAQESVLRIHFVPKITRQYEMVLRLQGRDEF